MDSNGGLLPARCCTRSCTGYVRINTDKPGYLSVNGGEGCQMRIRSAGMKKRKSQGPAFAKASRAGPMSQGGDNGFGCSGMCGGGLGQARPTPAQAKVIKI